MWSFFLAMLLGCPEPSEPVQPFVPLEARWVAERDLAYSGDELLFTLELEWPAPFPADDLVLHVLEDCNDSNCTWDDPREGFTWQGTDRAELVRVPDVDSLVGVPYGALHVGSDIAVCTREGVVTCEHFTPESASTMVLRTTAEAVHLPEREVTLAVGERRALSAWGVIRPPNVTDLIRLEPTPAPVVWSVQDPSRVSLTGNGIVEGLAVGDTTLTATVGDVQATMAVHVDTSAIEAEPFEGFHPFGPVQYTPVWGSARSGNQKLVTYPPDAAPVMIQEAPTAFVGDQNILSWAGYPPLVLAQWTGTGWSRELITDWLDRGAFPFLADDGGGQLFAGFVNNEGVVLLDRAVDAPAGTAMRRRVLADILPEVPGPLVMFLGEHTPEFGLLAEDGVLWLGASLIVQLGPDDTAGALADGFGSNCQRVVRLWRIEGDTITSELLDHEDLFPFDLAPPDPFSSDCDLLDNEHYPVYLAGSATGSPSVLTGGKLYSRWAWGWEGQDPLASPQTKSTAARALMQSPGVASDEPIWDEEVWAPVYAPLSQGFSIAGLGAWSLGGGGVPGRLLLHVLPWGGYTRDASDAWLLHDRQDSTTLWTADDGLGAYTSFHAGHGWVGWIGEGPRPDILTGLWLTRFDGFAAEPDAPLEEGRQLVDRDAYTLGITWDAGDLQHVGSTPPVHYRAVSLSDGRVGLLGTAVLPTFQNDTVQRVGDDGHDAPIHTPCFFKESTIVADGADLLVMCSALSNGANAEVTVHRLAADESAFELDTSWPGGGAVFGSVATPDGSSWWMREAGLDQLDANGLHTLHPWPTELEAEAPTDDATRWGAWPVGEGFVVAHLLPKHSTDEWTIANTRQVAFWQWSPDSGFAPVWAATVPTQLQSSYPEVYPRRGGVVAGKWFMTTRAGPVRSDDAGATWTAVVGDFDYASAPGLWNEGANGFAQIGDAGVWIDDHADEPGLSRVEVRWTTDGLDWTDPTPALDNGSGYQMAWAAVGMTDGRLFLTEGDSRGPGLRDRTAYAIGIGSSAPVDTTRNTPLLHEIAVAIPPPE